MMSHTAKHMSLATEALYDAVIDPSAWDDVMRATRTLFHSRVEALYYLDFQVNAIKPVRIQGVSKAELKRFSSCFYTPDNPCLQTPDLHQPGVLRTDQHLVEHFRDPSVLVRSTYYNEWMRPQDLGHTMGTTPQVEEDLVLNWSVLRPADRGAFSQAEQRDFATLVRHLERAMRMVLKLDTLNQRLAASTQALDLLPHGIAVLDGSGTLLQANRTALRLLAGQRGLCLRKGKLAAREPRDQDQLDALLRQCTALPETPSPTNPAPLVVQGLVLQATPLFSSQSLFVSPRAAVLVSLSEPLATPLEADAAKLLAALFGLTPAEARLASAMLDGGPLREVATRASMSYATARWYLKILFQKTGTARQSDLVRNLSAAAQRARPLSTH